MKLDKEKMKSAIKASLPAPISDASDDDTTTSDTPGTSDADYFKMAKDALDSDNASAFCEAIKGITSNP